MELEKLEELKSANNTISIKQLLTILIPMVIYLIGLSVTGFRTLIQHGDAIETIQVQMNEDRDSQKSLRLKVDDKFDRIQFDLTEIKLLLKDKQDRK